MEKPKDCPEYGTCPECQAHARKVEGAITEKDGKESKQEPYFKAVYATCAACPLNRGK